MDALRAEQQYIKNPTKIDQFLGAPAWLDRWMTAKRNGAEFPRFLAEEFAASMATMKYIPPPFYSMRKIFLYEKNIPLYQSDCFRVILSLTTFGIRRSRAATINSTYYSKSHYVS